MRRVAAEDVGNLEEEEEERWMEVKEKEAFGDKRNMDTTMFRRGCFIDHDATANYSSRAHPEVESCDEK
jgi:hypothetical protein